MNKIEFTCSGHENILSTHKNTLEFTKDTNLTLKGNCIVGVNSNFIEKQIKEVLKWNKIKIIVECHGIKDEIEGIVNKEFSSKDEIVIRKSNFISNRTLVIMANKGSTDLNRKLINQMKSKNAKTTVILQKIN